LTKIRSNSFIAEKKKRPERKDILPAEITIFPLVLAVMGTMHAEPRDATIKVFRGRRVDPNSIFCGGHEKIQGKRPVSDFECSKWMSGRVINAGPLNEKKKIELR
jgi:hypothetical protein